MAEGSGGYTGYRQEGSYEVRYKNGEEVSRRWINGGSGSSGAGGYEGGEGGGYGAGGWSARIEAIRESCRSILAALTNGLMSAQKSLADCRSNWARDIYNATRSVKEAANKLIPQTSKTDSKQIKDIKNSIAQIKDNFTILKQHIEAGLEKIKQIFPKANKGDPVIKSSGLNRQTNTDISMETFGGTYAVTRHHAPCGDKGGLLGSSWASSLDTRIIRGLDPDRSQEI